MEPRWVWAATVNFNSNLTAEYSTGIATISSPDTNYWGNTNAGINTTASVGIGTTNPTNKLDVIGGNIRVGKTSNGQFIGENSSGSVKIKLDTDGDATFNGGNVGIGTKVPTTSDCIWYCFCYYIRR